MIKLYLHCGYHKTGSSFLQSLFALNRQILLENKIYFPLSKQENEMLSGNISPGNGMELVEAIRTSNQDLIVDVLNKWKDDTIKNSSKILLISSEGLFHVLAQQKFIELFVASCNIVGFENINALLFLRDPISHAFSVYQHRGKRGGIPNYANWLKNKYETLDLTKSLLSFYNEFDINWTFRKYKSNSNFMSHATFEDWLDVKIPDIKLDGRVNISLTLSEIAMMTEVKDILPQKYLTDIHAKLSNLSKFKKANDKNLQDYYKEVSYNILSKYIDIVTKVNIILPLGEKLKLEELKVSDMEGKEVISLSRDQANIFFGAISSNNKTTSKIIFNLKILFLKIKGKLS